MKVAALVVGAACAACGSQPQPTTTPHPVADGPDVAAPPSPAGGPTGGPVAPPASDGGTVATAAGPTAPAGPTGPAVKFGAETVCVTHGTMRGLHVSDSSMRAVVRGSSGDAGAVEFSYDGPTRQVSHLKSGAVREQMALKLRAEDGCNLVYVVWRFSPKPLLVVQTKLNPGEHTNAECGTNNYKTVSETPLGRPAPGSKHVLEASIQADHLYVKADGRPVWDGALPDNVRDLHGPLGIRTDNVEATVALSGPAGSQRDDESRCHAVGAD